MNVNSNISANFAHRTMFFKDMKRLFCMLVMTGITAIGANAQTELNGQNEAFKHLDGALTLGTTGVGIEVATPVGNSMRLRVGASYMPRFDYNMTFGVQVGDDPSTSSSKFERLSSMLESFTGSKVDDRIDMIGNPTYYNFNLLVDVMPFKNKHWHITAGFYLGPSDIAKAYNKTEDMPSLMAVGIYNNMYNKLHGKSPWELTEVKLIDLGPGYENVGSDLEMLMTLQDKFDRWGRMGIHLGDRKDGSAYMMEPDENLMVKARMKANSFKPYIGFGYGGRLLKNSDRYQISFDCGMMFWGGKPDVLTHDGTNLITDVDNVGGKVGDYIKIIKKFDVFPVLNVKLSRRLF